MNFFFSITLSKEPLKLIDHGQMNCIERFLNEYVFAGRDYTTATSWSIPLSETIQYNEKIQID